jgi:hypothetical protein
MVRLPLDHLNLTPRHCLSSIFWSANPTFKLAEDRANGGNHDGYHGAVLNNCPIASTAARSETAAI